MPRNVKTVQDARRFSHQAPYYAATKRYNGAQVSYQYIFIAKSLTCCFFSDRSGDVGLHNQVTVDLT